MINCMRTCGINDAVYRLCRLEWLQKLEDELSDTFRSEFGDDNSEFGGRVNGAFDSSTEAPSGSGSPGGATAVDVAPAEEAAVRVENEELDEEFEIVDGKRAITLQVSCWQATSAGAGCTLPGKDIPDNQPTIVESRR